MAEPRRIHNEGGSDVWSTNRHVKYSESPALPKRMPNLAGPGSIWRAPVEISKGILNPGEIGCQRVTRLNARSNTFWVLSGLGLVATSASFCALLVYFKGGPQDKNKRMI
eukprot:TRINITY_DN5110_c0_g1_i1.p1 TRINITY_DN5110_c0_g1~~TRINITY_DN5110_c0_g1_i1.p1  ORF type:complete len:110 (-),score=16.70 TRINITY_DN5110_c0_g1_i1:171-500(-)